jgi:hypothetical protein
MTRPSTAKWTHARLAAAGLALLLANGCAAPRAANSPGTEVALADIGRQPQAFRNRTLLTRGWLMAGGELPEGVWLRLAVSDPGLRRDGDAPPNAVTLLLPPGAAFHGDDLRGKEIELLMHVHEPVVLGDGRQVVRVHPLQLSAMTRYAPRITQAMPPPLTAAPAVQGGFFRDPQLPASSATQPAVKFTFVEPDVPRPFWYLPGPVTIEKSGDARSPEYRFTTRTRSESGYSRESMCRFRVEADRLRSVAYDEITRDPTGSSTNETHLDFLSGTVMDKVTGARGPWPQNIYPANCLGFALGGFPFRELPRLDFFGWSEFEPLAAMYAVLDGSEQVTVPAGRFECYRVRMNVDTERMVRRLAFPSEQAYDLARGIARQMQPPDTVVWLTTGAPHVVVKLEGPLGPPGTSRAVMELVEMTNGRH